MTVGIERCFLLYQTHLSWRIPHYKNTVLNLSNINFNPNQTKLFLPLRDQGGRNQDAVVFATLSCYFSLKSHIYGLKWKFRSSFVCRINNCYPLLCDFVVGQFWSKVGLSLKYFSFCYINFWKIILFDKYVQYAHQMKAENM